MTPLITRLEQAERGTPELSLDVCKELFEKNNPIRPGMFRTYPKFCYCTTSLDACCALMNELDLNFWHLATTAINADLFKADVGYMHNNNIRTWTGMSPSPAIALCIAILRAVEAKEAT